MRNINILALACTCAITVWAEEPQFRITSTAILKDGSVLKADFLNIEVSGDTAFIKGLSLNPGIIKTLDFKGTNGEARVTLVNNDNFAIKVADENYKIKSSLGELSIPRQGIRSLSFKKVKAACASDEGLIFYCNFDDQDAVQNPAIGPSACFNKATISNDGKNASALFAKRYAPQAAFDLPPQFLGKAGCIEFWSKIMKSSQSVGWGGDPRFFTICDKNSGDSFCTLDVVSNNGAGNSGFATWTILGNMASIRGMHNLTYSELFQKGDSQDWHHYAIVWDDSGIKGLPVEGLRTALLVDGKLTSCVKFDSRDSVGVEQLINSPTRLSFTHDPEKDPEHQTKSPFLIDEFKIWNYAKTEFDIGE